MTRARTRRGAVVVGGVLVLLAAPQVFTGAYTQNLLILSVLFAVVAACWDLTIGYTGIFNFAHVAFFGIGVYTAGIVTTRYGIGPWLSIPLAAGAAVLGALLVSIPVARLRGIYVALASFALAALVQSLVLGAPGVTGGANGLALIPSLTIGSYDFAFHNQAYFYVAEALLLVTTVGVFAATRSTFGLSLIGIRDFEAYAASRGIPVARQKTIAMVTSAVFTGAAGAIYALYLGVASPDVFGFGFTTLFLSMVIVGGTGTLFGPILAAIVFGIFENARQIASLGDLRFMLIAVVTILVLIFARRGLWGAVVGALRDVGRFAERKSLRPVRTAAGALDPPPAAEFDPLGHRHAAREDETGAQPDRQPGS
jgi:branched-chain amino acid transport system permease protein